MRDDPSYAGGFLTIVAVLLTVPVVMGMILFGAGCGGPIGGSRTVPETKRYRF